MKPFVQTAIAAAVAIMAWSSAQAQSAPQPGPGMPMMHGPGMMHGQGAMRGQRGVKAQPAERHGPHRRGAMPAGDDGPSSLAYAGANNKMHRDMAITYTGDADVDFVRGMIPHHQGAIDMAKIVVAFGDDPEIRKLAEGIIAAQEAEIAQMRAWLEAHAN